MTSPQPIANVPSSPLGANDAPILQPAGPGRGKRLAFAVVVAVLLASIVREVGQSTRGARGPTASSYATSPGGLAALRTLLTQQGTDVVQLTKPIDEAFANSDFLAGDRLVVLDQDLSPAEVETLRTFVSIDGDLLGGGSRSGRWIGELWDRGDEEAPDGAEVADVRAGAPGNVATIGDGPARTLQTAGTALVWRDLGGEFSPIVVDDNFRVVLARQGSFDALADPSLLSNQTLAEADNAAFALELLATNQRVVFAEAAHGFRTGPGAGLAAIPSNVRTLLLGLLLATFVWMLAIGRRIGGPDLPSRTLPPGRYAHVAAVASLLDRTSSSPSETKEP